MSTKRVCYEKFNKIENDYTYYYGDKTYPTSRNVNVSGTHLMKTMLGVSETRLKVNVDGTRTLLLFMNVKCNNKS